MKISYAITVCNELEEIKKLISHLLQHKREEDEIVVFQDLKRPPLNNIEETYEYLISLGNQIVFTTTIFDGNFSTFKNTLNYCCIGDYIFQIDADEIPSQTLIENLPLLLESNPEVDLYWVPRENYVKNITPLHLQKWGWNQDDKGRINYPDFQTRIYKNTPNIKGEGKVHERIVGFKTYSTLPINQNWDLLHIKSLERQEKQNNYYNTL
jgi:glycosyltransferase involved in cell wall biosynthesis